LTLNLVRQNLLHHAAVALPAFGIDRLDVIGGSADGKRLLAARPIDAQNTRAPANVLLDWRPPVAR